VFAGDCEIATEKGSEQGDPPMQTPLKTPIKRLKIIDLGLFFIRKYRLLA
jgi:hypothetical protein